MRWHKRLSYKYRPEDSSEEREAADRIEAHREDELRTSGEVWDEIIRRRLDEALPQANRVRRRPKRTLRRGLESDLVWGSLDEEAPTRQSRVS
jgi:hypothetical protein